MGDNGNKQANNKQLKTIQLSKVVSEGDKIKDKGHYVNMGRDSYIWCFDGWRGGGKTTAMTFFSLKANAKYNMNIVGNYPIDCYLQLEHEKRHIKAEELDFQKILSFHDELKDSLILIDEAPDLISNMASTSWKNRLVNMFVRQIRKNNNSLFLGAQYFELIDKSLRNQVDIIVHCEDASRKFGNNSMQRGACILLDFYDNSGMWTGHTWHEKGSFRSRRLNSACSMKLKPSIMWGNDEFESVYDTFYQQDLFESLRKAAVKVDSYEITDSAPAANGYISAATAFIDNLRNSGEPTIYTTDFFNSFELTAKEKNALSKQIAACDVRRAIDATGKRFYNFSDFDIGKFSRGNNHD